MKTLPKSSEIRQATIYIDDLEDILGRIQSVARHYCTHVVCFDADKMTGLRHVTSAIRNARRSFESGQQISNSFEMEALLFATGSRQCSIAASFGIHERENRLYVCCCPAINDVWEDLGKIVHFVNETWEMPLSPDRQKKIMDLFCITPEELEASGHDKLEDLVLERISLLNVNR
jgi:KEOPS complex subunit Cgi121